MALGSNATISNATAGNVLYIGNSGGGSQFSLGSNTLTVDGAGDTFINSSLGRVRRHRGALSRTVPDS